MSGCRQSRVHVVAGITSTLIFIGLMMATTASLFAQASRINLLLRARVETSAGSGRFHVATRSESWDGSNTAIIVCDMWDYHHCLNAVKRLEEFAPRADQVLAALRDQGVTVIHAPSSCMEAYADNPARIRAQRTPVAADLPADINSWCHSIPAEEKATYPIDQSDGGEDDDPQEHAEWAARLKAMGRNPNAPWKKQTHLLNIDEQRDYISDQGDEIWNILHDKGIDNVILVGVHTNMCVLGRPFGLRQMVRNGKRVVLIRDLTDTMYNPKSWPCVSHFSGTDLIIEHIEKYVCPTITSNQLLGDKRKPFRFQNDIRRHVAIIMAEDEYKTNRTLPEFASSHLNKAFRVTTVFGSDLDRNDIPGLEVLDDADVAILSIRRRVLRPKQMDILRRFVESGKPVIGIRTSSHAFALRDSKILPSGYQAWPEFDAQVFGGHYTGHHGHQQTATIRRVADPAAHPILDGLTEESFFAGGSLYKTSPVSDAATVLLTGTIEGQPAEPVAWTIRNEFGGRTFYTSLGHEDDFANPVFQKLLLNSVYWTAGIPQKE